MAMNKVIYVAYFCLCCLLWEAVLGVECPYKECNCGGITILCVNRNLTSMPQLVSNSSDLTSLILDMNRITTIPAGSLPPNLTEISLTHNPITTIDIAAFDDSANTLQLLVFWNARFTRIPDALLRLKVLRDLSIYDSSVIDWNVDVMKNIGPSLQSLYLKNAGIATSPSWIQYLSNLTDLRIDSCSVSSLPDNVLDLVTDTLETLSLFNNSLTEVPRTLAKLKVLRKLDLSNNNISNIESLPQTKLTSLFFNNNNISDAAFLSNSLRYSADSLRTLALQENQFTVIPDLEFLTNIGKIDFTFNKISDPNSGSLPASLFLPDFGHNFLPLVPRIVPNLTRISEMWIESNVITQITATDFPPKVIWVYLGHNLLTELTETTFPPNSTIRYLHLNDNPISRISDTAFINLQSLETIILQETKITRLPFSLLLLSSLVHFDASNSAELVCTCLEQGLTSLFMSLLPGDVLGDCGEIGIYTFYANLTSGCPTL